MLSRSSIFPGVAGPVVTVVMDGIGQRGATAGNAVADAHTPTLDRLFARYPHTLLKAHGTAVGMPSDEDMGNSEVGHNALGSGQVYAQGAALVNDAIASGSLFAGAAWGEIVANVLASGGTLHLLGLFSDGNVHSHIEHLKALVTAARGAGVGRVRIHALLDGRDVPATSALDYVLPFEQFLAGLRSEAFDARIASGGGRMHITMDRYEADWDMVARGWATHVLGEGRRFASAAEAIATLRGEKSGIGDQDLPAFVIATEGAPLGPIVDGDSVVFFNFRGDRAIEISRAFTEEEFTPFARARVPRLCYAGMLQYDGDLQIPRRFLVAPPAIRDTMGEYLSGAGVSQFAISETQKFGHVTYFWNGNRSGRFDEDLERWLEIPSDRVPFEERPWMKAAEITDALIAELKTGRHRVARVNYANGDMVGHTGNYYAAVMAVEAVDLALARLLPVIDALGGVALVTADHGNAEEMFEIDRKSGAPSRDAAGHTRPKTSHTLNPVPLVLYDNQSGGRLSVVEGGLANVAATTLELLGFAAPGMWRPSLLRVAQ
ncbi:MAG TPA: 2,3-bisphosphoglycerate-independent phosphoglycerate mutase [Pseudomonadales bacterium]|nr:2,3-bisphosphoglycerate-independent phosphoglycerate mutase [Pseudomonadales bacterium]